MVRNKFFLTFLKEHEWLISKNRNGYELDSRRAFRYDIKKTCIPVNYEYVFLKKGKKSYKAFDYKSKDPEAKAVYANADILLIKKPMTKGDITVFASDTERKRNAAEKRTALNISSLLLLGTALIGTVPMRLISQASWVFLAIDICLILMAAYNYYLSYQIKKYISDKVDKK